MNFQILNNFGLNPNDIIIYQTLLNLGRSKTGPIIKATTIASSRVYESLRHLVTKGLVSYQVRNNIKYYQAEAPDQLLTEAKKHETALLELTRAIKSSPIPKTDRNEVNVYEGVHGFKKAFEQHIAGLDEGEVVSILALIGTQYNDSKDLRLFFKNTVDREMLRKHCTGRMIINKKLYEILKKERPDISIYSGRYLPSRYSIPYSLNISKKEVLLSVWGDSPIVFSIKNPIVVASFQKNFEVLWKSAKPC